MMKGSRGGGVWRRKTLILGLMWLLSMGVFGHEAAKLVVSAHHEMGQKLQRSLEINFVSKRKVPNGPDPIHNRRAGNSHRPPGQA